MGIIHRRQHEQTQNHTSEVPAQLRGQIISQVLREDENRRSFSRCRHTDKHKQANRVLSEQLTSAIPLFLSRRLPGRVWLLEKKKAFSPQTDTCENWRASPWLSPSACQVSTNRPFLQLPPGILQITTNIYAASGCSVNIYLYDQTETARGKYISAETSHSRFKGGPLSSVNAQQDGKPALHEDTESTEGRVDKRWPIGWSSHLPQWLFVGFFDALPLGDGAMRDDGRDRSLVGACQMQHHRNSVGQSLSIKLDLASPMPPCSWWHSVGVMWPKKQKKNSHFFKCGLSDWVCYFLISFLNIYKKDVWRTCAGFCH